MKILVTGAGGFIGSNLCNLLSNKHEILAVSRNFDKLISQKKLFFFQCEMSNYIKLNEIFTSFKPDAVIHCAWMGGNSSKDINELWQTDNITYSNILIKLSKDYKIKHFIGIGTSLEYGIYNAKLDENTICNPQNMYGIAKYCFKSIAENYFMKNNIKFSWVRPVFTYGPNDVKSRFIPRIISSFIMNEDIRLNACTAVVDYLYIQDLCDAIKYLIEYELEGNFVISSDNEYNTKNIVNLIFDKIKPNCNIIFDSSIADNSPQYICGSSKKIKSLTNWYPKFDFEFGIDKTIEFHKRFFQ